MTFEELSTASEKELAWFQQIGYLDAVACRQLADDWCAQPVFVLPAPTPPVSEPATAAMMSLALVAAFLFRRRFACRH